MITYTMQDADLLSDELLVGLTLQGDRDAFGKIVARYQSPICALAYSACGSFTRSEDLAQEVFIAAWRRLRELKEPAKLKAWLYAIARNLICTTFRQQSRNPLAAADPFDEVVENTTAANTPAEAAVSKEEEAILWQVLSGLPEIYRQPMVLFYRQEESIESVADILGISEEAVRQRLSRGRGMMNERVSKVVEIGLRRSGPSKAFALGVLAALPVASAKAGVIGAAGAATKGTGLLPGSGALSLFGTIISTVGGILCAFVGFWGRIKNARSERERRFARGTVMGLLGLSLGFVFASSVLFRLGVFRMTTQPSNVLALSVFWLLYMGPLFFFSSIRSRQRREIQIREGADQTSSATWLWNLDPAGPGFGLAIYGALACLIFVGCGWLMTSAIQVHDDVTATLLFLGSVSIWLGTGALVMRRRKKAAGIVSAVWFGLVILNLVLVNLRWDCWFAGGPLNTFTTKFAPWAVSYLIVFLSATSWMGCWFRQAYLTSGNPRRTTGVWGLIYLSLLITCSIFAGIFRS